VYGEKETSWIRNTEVFIYVRRSRLLCVLCILNKEFMLILLIPYFNSKILQNSWSLARSSSVGDEIEKLLLSSNEQQHSADEQQLSAEEHQAAEEQQQAADEQLLKYDVTTSESTPLVSGRSSKRYRSDESDALNEVDNFRPSSLYQPYIKPSANKELTEVSKPKKPTHKSTALSAGVGDRETAVKTPYITDSYRPRKPGYIKPSAGYRPSKDYSAAASNYAASDTDCNSPGSDYSAATGDFRSPASDYSVAGTGYASPDTGYGTPNTGYGTPNTGYATPGTGGYGAPGTGYDTPGTGYGAPGTGYDTPGTGYDAPGDSDHRESFNILSLLFREATIPFMYRTVFSEK